MSLESYFFNDYLETKEKIVHIVHRHFLVILKDFIRILVLGFGIPGLFWFLFPQISIIAIIWMIIGLGKSLYVLYKWYYDVWVITDRAVIDIKSETIWDITTTRIEYHMIEGMTYSVKGFWATIFNYGDILLEKIGGGTAVSLEHAKKPQKVETKILKQQEKYMSSQSMRDHQALRQLLAGMVRDHVSKYGVPD